MAGTDEGRGAGVVAPDQVIDLTGFDDALAVGDDRRLVEAVAVALGSTLDLREVLRRLVRIGHAASGARHCSLFVLDGPRLVPTVAVGDQPDQTTWEAFRSMGPLDLDDDRLEILRSGSPVALEDVSASDLIPAPWLERFQPGAVVLVPLHAEAEPCGLIAVDWPEPREFARDEISLLGAIGTFAGIAIGNARLFETTKRRTRLQEALVRGAADLASSPEQHDVASRLCGAYADLIDARVCGVGLFDSDRETITTIAARGTRGIEGPLGLGEVPEAVVSRVWRRWAEVKEPIEFEGEPWFDDFLGGRAAGAGWYLLLPLVVEGHARGGVLLGLESDRRLDDDERSAVGALASMAAAALERCILLERQQRQCRQLDALSRASAALADGADARGLVDQLDALLRGHGIEVVGLAFSDEALARRFRSGALAGAEVVAWNGGSSHAAMPDGTTAVLVPLGDERVMSLRARTGHLDAEDRVFLETVARGLAEIARREALRAALEEAARDQALAEDRQRMAVDLHDTTGYMLWTIKLLALELAARLPRELAEAAEHLGTLAESGKRQLDEAARALAFLPATRRGLVASLRALAKDIGRDGGIAIEVRVEGRAARLDPDVERALYRVGHEAFANAWRHGQCTRVEATVEFGGDSVVLRVRDDGVGCEPEGPVEGVGLAGMHKAMKGVDGAVVFSGAPGNGFAVEARAPWARG